jgi:hypothetical protein
VECEVREERVRRLRRTRPDASSRARRCARVAETLRDACSTTTSLARRKTWKIQIESRVTTAGDAPDSSGWSHRKMASSESIAGTVANERARVSNRASLALRINHHRSASRGVRRVRMETIGFHFSRAAQWNEATDSQTRRRATVENRRADLGSREIHPFGGSKTVQPVSQSPICIFIRLRTCTRPSAKTRQRPTWMPNVFNTVQSSDRPHTRAPPPGRPEETRDSLATGAPGVRPRPRDVSRVSRRR